MITHAERKRPVDSNGASYYHPGFPDSGHQSRPLQYNISGGISHYGATSFFLQPSPPSSSSSLAGALGPVQVCDISSRTPSMRGSLQRADYDVATSQQPQARADLPASISQAQTQTHVPGPIAVPLELGMSTSIFPVNAPMNGSLSPSVPYDPSWSPATNQIYQHGMTQDINTSEVGQNMPFAVDAAFANAPPDMDLSLFTQWSIASSNALPENTNAIAGVQSSTSWLVDMSQPHIRSNEGVPYMPWMHPQSLMPVHSDLAHSHPIAGSAWRPSANEAVAYQQLQENFPYPSIGQPTSSSQPANASQNIDPMLRSAVEASGHEVRQPDVSMGSPPIPVHRPDSQTRLREQPGDFSGIQSPPITREGLSTPPQSLSEHRGRSTPVAHQDELTPENEKIRDGAITPRAATLQLGDAQWSQSQRHNRFAMNETYRIRHGSDPPAEMRILETSALERSRVGDNALIAALQEEKRAKLERGSATDIEVTPERGVEEGDRANLYATSNPAGATNMTYYGSGGFMSDGNNFFEDDYDYDGEWVPAKGGDSIARERAISSENDQPRSADASSSASMSPSSPELPTPLDQRLLQPQQRQSAGASDSDNKPADKVQSIVLQQKVLPLLRHDAHLASHVSGVGGNFSEAYDGRSYLPDDAEPDPEHLPQYPPPGARSGDHPILIPIRPHPLRNRGQRHHRLYQPPTMSLLASASKVLDRNKKNEDSALEEGADKDEEHLAAKAKHEAEIVEQMVNKDEQGDGFGFVESGSFGEYKNGLVSEAERKKRSHPRLKLSTEKKTAPKMACLFCRQRKIACGPGDNEGTCNQCQKRSIQCNFPTESRRGMRQKKPRKTGKDNVEDGDDPESPTVAEPTIRQNKGTGKRGRRVSANLGKKTRPRARGSVEEDNNDEDINMDEEQPQSAQLISASDPLSLFVPDLRDQETSNDSSSFQQLSFYPDFNANAGAHSVHPHQPLPFSNMYHIP